MFNMWLQQQRATKIDLCNNLSSVSNTEMKLEVAFKYDFGVEYAADMRHCKAVITQTVESKNDPNEFHISVTVEGTFETDPILDDDMKKETHIRCYYELFPYVQTIISQVGTTTGAAPLIVPADRIGVENVVVNDR